MTSRSSDYLAAALSGVLLALSFPKFGHPALAWIALTPLIVTLDRGTVRRAFFCGLLTGVVYFAGTLYWITRVMVVYGDMPSYVAVPVHIALVAYLALFPAAFAAITRQLIRRFGARALLAAPFVWVATELGRTVIFTGFPWVLLGYSQVSVLPVAQFASVLGVYGVSAVVCAISTAAAHLVMAQSRTGRVGQGGTAGIGLAWPAGIPLAIVLVLVLGVATWGARRVARGDLTRAGEPVRVGLIQGNVEQGEKWDVRMAPSIFANYVSMTRNAIGQGAQLVLWPESSTPFFFEGDQPKADIIRQIATQANVTILFGSDQISREPRIEYFNAAYLVDPSGKTAGVYRKMHLVPFGEYVPLRKLLFFAGPLVERIGEGFTAGTDPVVFPVNGHPVSTAICYEIVYPNLVRQFVRRGSELLTTITNDAWFGSTSAPYQHFAQASMRAIEQGRYLVRSANTGISGIVDPYGRVLVESGIYEPAIIVADARFLQTETVYARVGDAFAYVATALTLLLLLQSRLWPLSTN